MRGVRLAACLRTWPRASGSEASRFAFSSAYVLAHHPLRVATFEARDHRLGCDDRAKAQAAVREVRGKKIEKERERGSERPHPPRHPAPSSIKRRELKPQETRQSGKV